MNKILFFFAAIALSVAAHAQESSSEYPAYKIVFQMTSSDTLAHKALMNQIGNITVVAPQTQIEVVCHGPGLTMLQKSTSVVSPKVKELTEKGVDFLACEYSMKVHNVSKEEMLPAAGYVKAGILHIAGRQTEGWSYIKSGF